MGDVREANPDELEHLADLLETEDGSAGANVKLSNLFTRAAQLDASSQMAPLRPLQTWLYDTAVDLRGRAGIIRQDALVYLGATAWDLRGAFMPVIHGTRGLITQITTGERVGIPVGRVATYMADYAFDGIRPTNLIGRLVTAGMSPRLAGFLGGSHSAASFGGFMRNGVYFVPTAQQANLLRVAQGAYTSAVAGGSSRLAGFGQAMSNMGRASGVLRGLGIAGSAFGSVTGVANLISQGNPIDAFQRDPSGYSVDVAGTAFNTSMTAALVAPTPVTVGIAVGSGIAYGVTLIWDNWDTIVDAISDATDAVVDFVGDAAEAVADFAEDAVDTVVDVAEDAVDVVGDALSDVGDALSDAIGSLF